MRQLSLAVVGIDYPNRRGPARRFELQLCAPGELVDLVPEPTNPADEYAVAVYSCRGVQLGYITAERAPWIGAQIRAGRECLAIFQGMTERAGWLRLAFDGQQPELPPPTPKREPDPEPDFWPDYIPPDE